MPHTLEKSQSDILERLLKQGLKFQKLGQNELAHQAYSMLLEADPHQSDANYNMGLLAINSGKMEAALAFFETALEANADNAFYWVSYIDALCEIGRIEDAEAVYNQAIMNGAKGEGFDKLKHRLTSARRGSVEIGITSLEEIQQLPNILDALSLDQAIMLAKRKAKEGSPADAQNIFHDILYKFPNNRRAQYGIKALRNGSIKHASNAQEPPEDQLQAVFGLYNQGHFQQALKQAETLAQQFPVSANLCNIKGAIFKALKKFDLSVKFYKMVLDIRPNSYDTFNNIGNVFEAQGEIEKAIEAHINAIALKPDFFEAYYNLGIVFKKQGKLDKAIEAYIKCLEINPNNADALYNLGNAFQERGKLDEAIESYSKTLAIKPDFHNAYNNMGNALKKQGNVEKALDVYNKELSVNADSEHAWCNIGDLLYEQGKLQEAVEAYKKALNIWPDSAALYYNMGVVFKKQGKLDKAIEAYNKAIAIKPDYGMAHNNLSFALINSGRLKEGLEETEWRWKINNNPSEFRHFLQPKWDGKVSLKDKRVLIWSEQGIGDILRCSHLAPLISSQAKHCIFESPQKLIPLLSRSFPNIEIRPYDRSSDLERDDFDFHLPTGDLHKHFLTEITRNNRPSSFLFPDPIRIDFWKTRLRSLGSGPYVGISWKSANMGPERLQFYAPISEWAPLLTLQNITFINLQYVDCKDDLFQIEDEFGVTVHDFGDLDQYNNLADVAALCAALDCVVAIGNSVAVISAGVGTSTKYVIPADADWDNIIGNPVGPFVDVFRRNKSEPWSNAFGLVAQDIVRL
jgi:tetratricopeptide (TPR) repeat protein